MGVGEGEEGWALGEGGELGGRGVMGRGKGEDWGLGVRGEVVVRDWVLGKAKRVGVGY